MELDLPCPGDGFPDNCPLPDVPVEEVDVAVVNSENDLSDIDLDDFWAHLQDRALEHDAWWLDTWLDDRLEEYRGMLLDD
jgi:hypothetical protein